MPDKGYFINELPDSLRSPFRRLIYLGYLANTMSGVFHPLAGLALLAAFVVLDLSGWQRFFREASKGVLLLFTALYILQPSVVLLLLFTFYFQAVYYWGGHKVSHYLWIVAVSFIHLAVISTIMSSVAYPLFFLSYVFLLTHALLIANYLSGISDEEGAIDRKELSHLEKHAVQRMRGIGHWIAGISTAIAVLFFPILPRTQALSYQPTQASQESVSGFADEVTLGQIDSIQSDNRIAMRIFIPKELGRRVWRWRGAVLERWNFNDQKWSGNILGQDCEKPVVGGEARLFNVLGVPDRPEIIRVNLSSMADPRIFLPEVDGRMPYMVTAVEGQFSMVLFDRESCTCQPKDEMRYRGFEYQLRLLTDADILHYRPIPTAVDPDILERCRSLVTVPEGFLQGLEERGEDLAPGYRDRSLDPITLTQNLSTGLQQSQVYTLDFTKAKAAKNLREFLFEKKAGNCEYFATALALLLRQYGIPARLVTGFQSGRENLFRNYQMVRQSDAHSWVEVYFKDQGWVCFDPTPSTTGQGGFLTGQMALVADMYDYLQLQWNLYVIDYSQGEQKRVFSSLFDYTKVVLTPIFIGGVMLYLAKDLLAFVLFLLFLVWLVRELAPEVIPVLQSWSLRLPAFGWLRFSRRATHLATRSLRKMEKEWGKRGFERAASETPGNYLRRIAKAYPPCAALSVRFSDVYHATRFGRSSPEAEWSREIRALAAGLMEAARKVKR